MPEFAPPPPGSWPHHRAIAAPGNLPRQVLWTGNHFRYPDTPSQFPSKIDIEGQRNHHIYWLHIMGSLEDFLAGHSAQMTWIWGH